MGLSLTTITRFEKYLLLVGEGSNGKSVLLKTLKNMIGKKNVAAVGPDQFDNRFQIAYLYGKLVNLVPEIKEGFQINDAKIKAIVSAEEMTAEEKFKDPFTFRPCCKLWIAANHLPHTRDVSHAFFRRPVIIEFNRVFDGDYCDRRLSASLEEEIPGIINLAISGLVSLLRDGDITEPPSSLTAKKDWQKEVDQVEQFLDERCVLEPGAKCACAELFGEYIKWADSVGVRMTFSQNKLSRRLKRFKITNCDGTGGERLFSGLKVRDYGYTHKRAS